MKDKIRFIHASDIHLGANPYAIKERFNDMGKVFSEVVKYAIDNEVDFVIIPGDLFDKKNLNAKTLDLCIEIIKPLKEKNIPIYVTEGNHDERTYINNYSWLEFMNDNGYITLLNPVRNDILDEEDLIEYKNYEDHDNKKLGSYFINDDMIIYGLGFPGILPEKYVNSMAEKYIDNKENKVVITMLHTGINYFVTEGMGGVKEELIPSLIEKSDYIALGHIHNMYLSEENKYYNPGSLENTSIPMQIFDKGFFDVTIDTHTKKVEHKFIKVNNRKIYNMTIDINGSENPKEAYDNVVLRLEGALKTDNVTKDDMPIVSIKIKGEIADGSTNINMNELKNELKEKFNLLYIELQNQIKSKRLSDDIDTENLSREDIDKLVIKNLLKEKGFSDIDQDTLLQIVLKLKDLSTEGEVDLQTKEGNDIKDKILEYIKSKKEIITDDNVE